MSTSPENMAGPAKVTTRNAAFHESMHGMIRAHLWYGLGGLVLGLLIAAAMVTMGPEFLRASPLFTFIAMGLVMFLAVSMVGGLLSIWTAGAPARSR